MKQGQFPTVLPLASLNGQNGFELVGEATHDQNGISVSTAGDINSDGHVDLIIGANWYPVISGSNYHKGRSYVVFGGSGVGGSGLLNLSSLNGENGFKLDGERGGDEQGGSVSIAGDINGDGHVDLIVGAKGYVGPSGGSAGRSYVVFGGPGIGSGGLLALGNLNGTNGFKLDGELGGDYSGNSVSAAGDVNGDGYADLIIGAYYHTNSLKIGRSYVVFGGPQIGSSGLFALSSLNGTNGFKLDGEAAGDESGYAVSATDINGDGYSDLLIGAPFHANSAGRSYVVFGGPGVGSSGLLALNGTNIFKLDGEAPSDESGISINPAGDINGDGYADLVIGAAYHPIGNNVGRSYVVFGGPGVGGGLLPLSSLNGTNGFKIDGELNGDDSGFSVSAAGDINGDGYADLLIGAPNYGSQAGRTYVVFGGPAVGASGLFALTSLNGTNGFKLDGELSGDYSGWSVSTAGDINGDGRADLFIGVPFRQGSSGRSYVVFSNGSFVSTTSTPSATSILTSTIQTSSTTTTLTSTVTPTPSMTVTPQYTPTVSPITPTPTSPLSPTTSTFPLSTPTPITTTAIPTLSISTTSPTPVSGTPTDTPTALTPTPIPTETPSSSSTPVVSSASRQVGDPWISWISSLPVSLAMAGIRYLSAGINEWASKFSEEIFCLESAKEESSELLVRQLTDRPEGFVPQLMSGIGLWRVAYSPQQQLWVQNQQLNISLAHSELRLGF